MNEPKSGFTSSEYLPVILSSMITLGLTGLVMFKVITTENQVDLEKLIAGVVATGMAFINQAVVTWRYIASRQALKEQQLSLQIQQVRMASYPGPTTDQMQMREALGAVEAARRE